MTEVCCRVCRGAPPFLLCRAGDCFCHLTADLGPSVRLPYADPTANAAVARVMRGRNAS